MLTTLEEKLHPGNAAIIAVDLQNDFCSPDAHPAKYWGRDVSMHSQMMDGILRLIEEGRKADVPIVFLRNVARRSEVQQEHGMRYRARSGLPDDGYKFCEEGSAGVEFFRVRPEPNDIVITKHRYSGFIGTDFDVVLRSRGRKSLVFCGGGTNVCLESTARHAFMLDYYVVVVADCAPTPWGKEAYKATLANIELAFGEVITLYEALEVWSKLRKSVPA